MSKKNLNDFIAGFKLEGKMSIAHRIVEFLRGAAEVVPKEPIAKQLIAKAVFGLAKTPQKDGDKTRVVSAALTRAREIARATYGRSIHVEPFLGARMTVDDEDQVKTRVAATATRLNSAHRALTAEAALVDERKLPAGPHKKWFHEQVKPSLKLMEAENRIVNILPPKGATGGVA